MIHPGGRPVASQRNSDRETLLTPRSHSPSKLSLRQMLVPFGTVRTFAQKACHSARKLVGRHHPLFTLQQKPIPRLIWLLSTLAGTGYSTPPHDDRSSPVSRFTIVADC